MSTCSNSFLTILAFKYSFGLILYLRINRFISLCTEHKLFNFCYRISPHPLFLQIIFARFIAVNEALKAECNFSLLLTWQ